MKLLQMDFKMEEPWGEEMSKAFEGLAKDISTEEGLIWKIWTENEAEKEALDNMTAVGDGSYTKAQESYEKLVQDNETLTTTNTTLTDRKSVV